MAADTKGAPKGFFTLAQRQGHWWLIKPDGGPFFSLGLNHIDPASLRDCFAFDFVQPQAD